MAQIAQKIDHKQDVARKPQANPTAHHNEPEAPTAERAVVLNRQALSPGDIETLQHTAGNRAAARMVQGKRTHGKLLQAKLTVGPAGDSYEREADQVASQVMAAPSPAAQRAAPEEEEIQTKRLVQRQEDEEEIQTKRLVQRQEDEEEIQTKRLVQRQEDEEEIQTKRLVQRQEDEEEIQTKRLAQRQEDEEEIQTRRVVQRREDGGFDAGPDVEQRLEAQKGGGSPLPAETRAFMEPRFGADFSAVRLHTDSHAAQLSRDINAQAFTQGPDIFIGAGKYNPGTSAGNELLAHELTHVVQQGAAGSAPAQRQPARRKAGPGRHAIISRRYYAQQADRKMVSQQPFGTPAHIQRWSIKSFMTPGGHETLTEEALANADLDTKFEEGMNNPNFLEGANEAEQALKIKGMKGDILAGSRWNDMLHSSTAPGMALSLTLNHKGLTHASHEGQLQFLHSMAANMAEQAWQTRHKIMMWAEFCYKVATGDISVDTKLSAVTTETQEDIEGGPTFAAMFAPWGKKTVGWLFTGSGKQANWEKAKGMAIGSMLHMLQDSFCQSHTQREAAKKNEEQARKIRGFNAYTEQHGGPSGRHSKADVILGAKGKQPDIKSTIGAQEAVNASTKVIEIWSKNRPWSELESYLKGIFGLTDELEQQERDAEGKWGPEKEGGNRIVSGSGRWFRKIMVYKMFTSAFGGKGGPFKIQELRSVLNRYDILLNTDLQSINQKMEFTARLGILETQLKTLQDAHGLLGPAQGEIKDWKSFEFQRRKLVDALIAIADLMREDQVEIERDIASIHEAQAEGQTHE